MRYLKAYLAGIAFPATFLPLAYTLLYAGDFGAVRTVAVQFFPLYLPLIFGIVNVIYVKRSKTCPMRERKNARLWATGALLGLLLAVPSVFFIGLPKLLFGLTGPLYYAPLIFLPIIYGMIWRYIISYLNTVVGLDDL